MHAYIDSFYEFLNRDTRFMVPVYQRNYDWEITNAKRLFSDIQALVANPCSTHFTGAICFKASDTMHYDLVDGQQRITSCTLFIRALAELLTDESQKQALIEFLKVSDMSFLGTPEANSCKLSLNQSDNEIWMKFFTCSYEHAEKILSDKEKTLPIWTNYKFFITELQDLRDNGEDLLQYVTALRRLNFVRLEIDDENPQEIFESLNSTGLDLTDVDLLRNSFLMPFSHNEQTRLYNDYWHPMEQLFDSRNQMMNFFVDYLVLRNKSNSFVRGERKCTISKKSLYAAFKDYHQRIMQCDTEKMFSDMLATARLYAETIFSDDFDFMAKDVQMWRRYIFIGGLVVKQSFNRAILLHILEAHKQETIDEDTLLSCIKIFMSVIVRGRVCGRQVIGTQSSGNVIMRMTQNETDDFILALEKAFARGRGAYEVPSDDEVRKMLMREPVYEKGLRAYGLKAILYGLEWAHDSKGLPRFDDSTLSIEHIMPQTLSDDWKAELTNSSITNHSNLLHVIGNCALTNHNSELSNKIFSDKKPIYAQSNYSYTRELVGRVSWQDIDIKKRCSRLTQAFLELWSVPKIMSTKTTKVVMSLSLAAILDDTSQLTYRKPTGLYVGDDCFSVSSWRGTLQTLLNALDNISHDDLVAAIRLPIKGFDVRNDSVTLTRGQLSSADTAKVMGRLAQAFDNISDSNIADTIILDLS